jgi:uncharacterized protein involved in propanediol utilization
MHAASIILLLRDNQAAEPGLPSSAADLVSDLYAVFSHLLKELKICAKPNNGITALHSGQE